MITVSVEISGDVDPIQTIFVTSGGDAEHPQVGDHVDAIERARLYLAGVAEDLITGLRVGPATATDRCEAEVPAAPRCAPGGENAPGPAEAMANPKRLSIAEFRRLGFLQEANRIFFHPLGLALDVVLERDGRERLGGIWDGRDDPEGVMFADPPDPAKASTVAAEWVRHAAARRVLFGDVVQPLKPGVRVRALPDLPRTEA